MKNLQGLKDIIYQLKQDYGFKAVLIKNIKESTDSLTGERTVLRDILPLKRVVELPEDVVRKYWYDIAFIKANTNFTYGAEVDIKSKKIIVDNRDLRGRTIEIEDFIMLKHQRFQIERVFELEQDVGCLVSLKAAQGATPYDVITLRVQQNLQIYSITDGVL